MAELDRVLIAGAGIAGLTTAVALQQAGVEAVVLERRHEPGKLLTGGGFMLWHNAFLALRELKLDEAVAAAGQEIDLHEFRTDRDRTLATWQVGRNAERIGAPAVALRRSELNRILMDAVDDVRLGAAVTGYRQDAGGVTVELADGRTERGDVLIGADGLRSAVRATLRRGHDLPPRYSGYTAWQAITRLRGEDAVRSGTFYNLWGKGGLRFLYCRLNEEEVYWDAITCDHVSGAFDTVRHTKREVLHEAYRHWPEPVPQLIAGTDDDAILSIDIVDPMTLNLSQGAGQSIEDAVVLTRHLTGAATVPEAIAAYELQRRERAMAMVRTSWNIGAMGRWRDGFRSTLLHGFMKVFFGTVGQKSNLKLMMDVSFRDREGR
ncbi:MAG: hypothetical protein AUG49_22975 [Catenulispora sp. 13_1_20CM_3_70_7]|nr:MAG: hypothetical protein AUG49_22975 [Catenulispora sp. 13_1_20CM_3_70_7]